MTIPNILTLMRLAAVPFIMVLFRDGRGASAAVIFVLAMITDALDGWLASKLSQRSSLGTYLDAVVDKIVILSMFYELGCAGLLHPAVPHLFLTRELLHSAVRSTGASRGTVIGANWMGKTKALLQSIVITMGLLQPFFASDLPSLACCSGNVFRLGAWIVLLVAWCFFAAFAYRNRAVLLSNR